MGVASTVSRLPITVKVVPVSGNEDEAIREQQQQQRQQQQSEQEEERTQQRSAPTQAEEEAVQTGKPY